MKRCGCLELGEVGTHLAEKHLLDEVDGALMELSAKKTTPGEHILFYLESEKKTAVV